MESEVRNKLMQRYMSSFRQETSFDYTKLIDKTIKCMTKMIMYLNHSDETPRRSTAMVRIVHVCQRYLNCCQSGRTCS